MGGTGTGSYRTLFLLLLTNSAGTTRNFVPFVPFVPTLGASFRTKPTLHRIPCNGSACRERGSRDRKGHTRPFPPATRFPRSSSGLALIGRIAAYDIDGRLLGRFGTSLEAVSACFAAWRLDGQPAATEQGEELLFEAISARMLAGTDD